MKILPLLLASLLILTSAPAHDATLEMAKAANALIDSLTPEQKAKVSFPFASGEKDERTNWHYIPRERKGLPLKEMTAPQRELATALLKTSLSENGYKKAKAIQDLESLLREMEKGNAGGPVRDPELYFVSIFGTPGGPEPWGWRWEGHHQSFNHTCVGDSAPSLTPSFFGSNPGEVKDGPMKGTRVLGREEDLGRALVKSLNEEQLKQAIILPEAPKEIFDIPGRNDTKPEGIPYSALDLEQKSQLLKLVKEHLFRSRRDVVNETWDNVTKGGLDKLFFGWAGGLEVGQPHYYRVQAGNFVLEYDNVQNNGNHPHTVWRDFDHDFGLDALAEHYKNTHAK